VNWHIVHLLMAAYAVCWVIGSSKLTLALRRFLGAMGSLQYPGDNGWPAIVLPFLARWLLALVECSACLGWWIGLCYGVVTHVGLVGSILAGLLVLTTNLILEAIVSHIKE
jgi:hypothetical protein